MYLLIAILIVLAAGLFIMNLRIRGNVPAAWIRVLAVYGLAAVVLTPMVMASFADPLLKSTMREIFAEMARNGMESGVADLDAFLDFTLGITARTYALVTTLFILFCWYVTTRFRRRKLFQWNAALALANFRIAEYMVWPLLVSLAVFGIGRVTDLPPNLDIAVTEILLGLVLVYFFQGLGIITAWFSRQSNPGLQRFGLPLVLAILFLVPYLNIGLLFGIPLLGILELWVRLRPVTQE